MLKLGNPAHPVNPSFLWLPVCTMAKKSKEKGRSATKQARAEEAAQFGKIVVRLPRPRALAERLCAWLTGGIRRV